MSYFERLRREKAIRAAEQNEALRRREQEEQAMQREQERLLAYEEARKAQREAVLNRSHAPRLAKEFADITGGEVGKSDEGLHVSWQGRDEYRGTFIELLGCEDGSILIEGVRIDQSKTRDRNTLEAAFKVANNNRRIWAKYRDEY